MSHSVDATTTDYFWDIARSLPVVLQDGTNTYVYGVDTDHVYDDANRLTDLTNTGPGPTTISDFHYELDDAGYRTEMTDLSGTHEYVYDALYRLTEVTYPDPETDAYTYDANGDRLTKDSDDYTYDAADQLTDLEGITYGYDESGNQTDRDTDTFDYDHENRLVEAVMNSVTSASEYNGDGLRMSLTVDDGSPVVTDYAWDVNRSLPVVLDDGANQYVYGLDLIAAIDGSDNEVYFTYDGLGSVTALTDDAGAATDTYSYDVFGATRANTGSTPNQWLFTGEQDDTDSNLYYLRARHYDSASGRFMSQDPFPGFVSMPATQVAYPYVLNNPVNFVDPYGFIGIPGTGIEIDVPDPIDVFDEAVDMAADVNEVLSSAGYVDIGGTACMPTPIVVGPCVTAGVQMGWGQGIHPYAGGGVGTPGGGISINFYPGQQISTGLTCGVSGGVAIYPSPAGGIGLGGEAGFSGISVNFKESIPHFSGSEYGGFGPYFGTPGVSATCYYVF